MASKSGKSYDWRGLTDEELTTAKQRWSQLVDFFISKLPPALIEDKSVPILYVGCGFGALQKTWIEKGYTNVEGIEWRQDRVADAREFGCSATQADYRKLPMFRDGQFRLVIADRVLSSQTNFDGVEDLSEIFRVCDDQAAVFLLFHKEWSPSGLGPFFDTSWNLDWGHYRGRLHATLWRGCEFHPRSDRSKLRWHIGKAAASCSRPIKAFVRGLGHRGNRVNISQRT